jgi:VCBS repeat-containing protein
LAAHSEGLALSDTLLPGGRNVAARLLSVIASGKGALPAGLKDLLQATLTTAIRDTTNIDYITQKLAIAAANTLAKFLSAGETVTVSCDIVVSDAHDGTITKPVTFVITGDDETPVKTSADDHGADPGLALLAGAAALPSTAVQGASSAQPVAMSVTGGAPVLAADTVAHALSDLAGGAGSTTPDIASATLTFNDSNLGDTHKVSVGPPTAVWSGGTPVPGATLSALQSALTATLTDSTHTGTGSVNLAFSAADGVFHFLSQGETLSLTYAVTITNNQGATSTQPVTFTVTGANDAPTLAADAAVHSFSDLAGGAGSTTPDTASATLTFSDPNLDDTHIVSIGAATAVWSGGASVPAAALTALQSALTATLTDSTHTGTGSVSLAFSAADGLFHFLSQGETLRVTYNVTVTDSQGATSTQPVTFTITGTDDAPTITAPAAEQVNENSVLTATAAGLLATASDPNLNNVLTLTSVGGAQNGTVSLANGVVIFTPAPNYFGSASYTYTVTDSHGQSATAVVPVTINPISAPPALALVDATGAENTPIPLSISATTADPAAHITCLMVSALPVGATLCDGAGGHSFTATAGSTQVDISTWTLAELTLAAPANWVGTMPLTVTATSQVATAAPATAVGALTVTSILDHAPPVAVNETLTVNEGMANTLNVLANDTDPAGLALSVSSVSGAAHGTVVINADNTITYTPTPGYLGADSFAYTASDGQGGASTATVNLTVSAASPVVAPLLSVGSNGDLLPVDGSALKTELTLHAGDVITFNWNFASGDSLPYNDFAFASVNGSVVLLSDVQTVCGYAGASGEHTFSYTATASGTFDLGIGVMNGSSVRNDSYLEVDSIAVNGVTVQSFSNGLTGANGVTSTSLGNVAEVTSATTRFGTTLTPAQGTHEAFLTTNGASENSVETFLGLGLNQLQTIAVSAGQEFSPIAVPISVTPASANAADTFITVSGAPVGTVFNNAVYDGANNSWQIDAANLGCALTFTTPSNYTGSFTLLVTATSVGAGASSTATSPAQTQVVTVTPAAVTIDGSAGNQSLVGGTVAGNTLIGGPADTLTGGSTSDTFVFKDAAFGLNTVTDFSTATDVLQFSHTVFADAATAMGHAAQVGADVVITLDAHDAVILKNVMLANLHASDFQII